MLLHDLFRRAAERIRIHLDIQTLENRDDRLLADMGITRRSIADQVCGRR